MRNVTDRTSNPFGMRAPEEDGYEGVVYGYGDANADIHLVGDHPGVHGGPDRGVPFTGSLAGRRLQDVLEAVGLLAEPYSDTPEVRNLFMSYRHMCATEGGRQPTDAEYAALEPYFDAELRAIAAHVLLPVGERVTRHVLEEYTARAHAVESAESAHAVQVPGRGFLVIPVAEPAEWGGDDAQRLETALAEVLAGDYRQTVDLGRFGPGGDPYFVR